MKIWRSVLALIAVAMVPAAVAATTIDETPSSNSNGPVDLVATVDGMENGRHDGGVEAIVNGDDEEDWDDFEGGSLRGGARNLGGWSCYTMTDDSSSTQADNCDGCASSSCVLTKSAAREMGELWCDGNDYKIKRRNNAGCIWAWKCCFA